MQTVICGHLFDKFTTKNLKYRKLKIVCLTAISFFPSFTAQGKLIDVLITITITAIYKYLFCKQLT